MKTYTAKVNAYGRLPDGRPYCPGDELTGLTRADVRYLHLSRSYYYVREESAEPIRSGPEIVASSSVREAERMLKLIHDPAFVREVITIESAKADPRVTVIRAAERRLRALTTDVPEVEPDGPIQSGAGTAADS